VSLDVLRTIYFAYVHSVISYGIIFWGNSLLSANIFKIQKRIIRIIMKTGRRESCRQLFNNFKYYHFLPNTYIHYLFLLTKIKNYLCRTLKFITLTFSINTIYICPLLFNFGTKGSSILWKQDLQSLTIVY